MHRLPMLGEIYRLYRALPGGLEQSILALCSCVDDNRFHIGVKGEGSGSEHETRTAPFAQRSVHCRDDPVDLANGVLPRPA